MTTTFDPDDTSVPAYDDRAPKVERVVNEVIARRNRGNRQRGKKAERLWRDLINEMCVRLAAADLLPIAETRGVLGGADVLWGNHAFEVKHSHGQWPSNTVIKNALVQAKTNAGNRVPYVVGCKTTSNSREWRVYAGIPSAFMDGKDWLRERVAEFSL